MKPADWTLLTIASAQRSLQPVQLQKSLFLLDAKLPAQVLPKDQRYKFKAFDYGPFSADVYNDAEELERAGLVVIRRSPAIRYREYFLTEAGGQRARELSGQLDQTVREYLKAVVDYTQSLDFNQLVTAIYREFPDMKVNSVFKDVS